jgi:hypothetical protein
VSEAPFRELFVELPRAVFETLQGIGEEAVRRAGGMEHVLGTLYPARPPTLLDVVQSEAGQALCGRYGWRGFEVRRLADRYETRLVVERSCGHRTACDLWDEVLLAPRTARDALVLTDALDEHDRTGRRCYCVQREERS